MAFSQNLKHALEMKGVSQRELAKRTGITEASISRYISGEREPRAYTLSKIASVLHMTMDELIGGR